MSFAEVSSRRTVAVAPAPCRLLRGRLALGSNVSMSHGPKTRVLIWILSAVCFAFGAPAPQSLREAAQHSGTLIGTAVRPAQLSEAAYAATLAREFNMLEPEDALKWEVLRPDPQSFDFSQADQLVDFAARHNMKVRGHTLVWHRQNPSWLTAGNFTPGQLSKLLETHIKTVVGHYRGRIFAWDVANEAFDEGDRVGKLRSTIWSDQPGIAVAAGHEPRASSHPARSELAARNSPTPTWRSVSAGLTRPIPRPFCSTTRRRPRR